MKDGIYKKFMFINCMIGLILTTGCGKNPGIGIINGRLAPCPNSPNCVSSSATDTSHHVDPLTYSGTREGARKTILAILNSMDRVRVVEATDDYIHAEFRSKIFRFVDDVEFFFPKGSSIIELRSASRVGYSDLGVNRKRVKEIRKLFNEKMALNSKNGGK